MNVDQKGLEYSCVQEEEKAGYIAAGGRLDRSKKKKKYKKRRSNQEREHSIERDAIAAIEEPSGYLSSEKNQDDWVENGNVQGDDKAGTGTVGVRKSNGEKNSKSREGEGWGMTSGAIGVDVIDGDEEEQEENNETERLNKDEQKVEGDDFLDVPEDSFSMLFVASGFHPHLLPFCIYFLQMAILSLILANLLRPKYDQTPTLLNVPVGVSHTVTVAQYIACLVTLWTAEDFIVGLLLFRAHLVYEHPSSSWTNSPHKISSKWEVSNFMRMSVGIYVMAVSFVFIVQSDNVLDLFLNFAAVAFVSELDDLAFVLSTRGFFGKDVRSQTEDVSHIKISDTSLLRAEERDGRNEQLVDERSHANRCCNFKPGMKKRYQIGRFSACFAVLLILFLGLTYLVVQQKSFSLMCNSVSIFFSTEPNYQILRHLSGTYSIDRTFSWNQRPVYIQNQGRRHCPDGKCKWSALLYDSYDSRWRIIQIQQNMKNLKLEIALSKRTQTFDVSQIEGLHFYEDHAEEGDIRCNDCNINAEHACGWSRGECTKEKKCLCNPGLFGYNCQFGPCTDLQMEDDEFNQYEKVFNMMYDPELTGNDPILFVHDRPIYYQTQAVGSYGLIFYDGSRWVVTKSDALKEFNGTTRNKTENYNQLALYMKYEFHAYYSDYEIDFLSEPTDKGAPSDVPFQALFLNGGDEATPGTFRGDEYKLNCGDCNTVPDDTGDDYFTFYEDEIVDFSARCFDRKGVSNNSLCQLNEDRTNVYKFDVHRCQCDPGFEGPLCQIRPVDGTISLYLEHETNTCSVCDKGNVYTLRDLDGLDNTCLPFPRDPIVFEVNGTLVYRQLLLMLNRTHFSVYVSNISGYKPRRSDDISCNLADGTILFDSTKRSALNERAYLTYVIAFDKDASINGMMTDEPAIECPKEVRVDSTTCAGPKLSDMYQKSYMSSSLSRAWIHFDFQITPLKDASV